MQKRWRVMSETIDGGGEVLQLPERFALHPVASALLRNRGIDRVDVLDDFLSPDWDRGIHDPFLFSQMRAAVDRIFVALEQGERITVHGDYDADGVTGSAVLISTLREIERVMNRVSTMIDFYIPHRDEEGYGLHDKTVEVLHERGTRLLITVDCGISCVNEIALAKIHQIDTIVVDHHQFGEALPDGILIHPKLPGEIYPFPHLAAVGVAWKLACALLREARQRGFGIPEGWEKWLLDFVSIATVTDMVQMVGENRVLETYGLKVLNKTRRPGLRALIELAGCALGSLTTESIGFFIGPRINAAGRMDRATVALQLLLAENEEEAQIYGKQIETLNRRRKQITIRMMEDAEQQLASGVSSQVVILWSETWSPSLVGIVAGKYLDQYGKPTIAIGKHGARWVGSGRSFAAYDITEAMKRAGEGILSHVGGHVQACGFSFVDEATALERLIVRLQEDAAERLSVDECLPVLSIDAELLFEDITWQLVDTLGQFEPHGEGNKRPLFMTRGLEVVASDLVGSAQNHIRCTLRHTSGHSIKCIGFKLGSRFEEFALGSKLDVVYDVSINEWNGRKELQCKLVDARPAS